MAAVWDYTDSYIISASNSKEAREIANNDNGGDEHSVHLDNSGRTIGHGNDIWLKPKFAKLKKIGKSDVKRGIVLGSFNAG